MAKTFDISSDFNLNHAFPQWVWLLTLSPPFSIFSSFCLVPPLRLQNRNAEHVNVIHFVYLTYLHSSRPNCAKTEGEKELTSQNLNKSQTCISLLEVSTSIPFTFAKLVSMDYDILDRVLMSRISRLNAVCHFSIDHKRGHVYFCPKDRVDY